MHYELQDSPLRRACRIVHLEKVCIEGRKSPQECPRALTNFIVWDCPEPSEMYQERSSKSVIPVRLRGWRLDLEETCNVTAAPATIPADFLENCTFIAQKLDFWALPCCVLKKKSKMKNPVHIFLIFDPLELEAAVAIHTSSPHMTNLVSTTASLNKTFTVCWVNCVADVMEVWRF